jgi:hypothetical protein
LRSKKIMDEVYTKLNAPFEKDLAENMFFQDAQHG